MTSPPHDYSRRRADDVYRVIETDVFPRLQSMDQKIGATEAAIHQLQIEGCAHRAGDLRRTQTVEEGMARIFEKIDDLGDKMATHQLVVTKKVGEINTDMVKKVGGVQIWILTSCVVGLVAILSLLASGIIEKWLK